MKQLVQRILRWLMYPVRKRYQQRNGVTSGESRHEIPNDVFLGLVSETLAEGHTAVIWVKGYSMRPFIEFGRDKVKLAPPTDLRIGDAVLGQISPGHYVLHRIIRMENGMVTLQGDGNLCGVEQCRLQDVCGKVVEYIRPNRVIYADDAALQRKILVWRFLRPARRLLLFIYKTCI